MKWCLCCALESRPYRNDSTPNSHPQMGAHLSRVLSIIGLCDLTHWCIQNSAPSFLALRMSPEPHTSF